tara:strand:- start:159 stop:407 length:249 start_codon:yes stop_codon:yes gene_type:complete
MLILQILLAACCLASVTLCLVQRLQFSARLNKTDAFIAQLNAQQAQFDVLRDDSWHPFLEEGDEPVEGCALTDEDVAEFLAR